MNVGDRLHDEDAQHKDDEGKQCRGRDFEVTRTDPGRIDFEGQGGDEARCVTCLREFAAIEGKIQIDPFE